MIKYWIFIFLITSKSYCQIDENNFKELTEDKITIPFDFSNNMIIINAQLNGVELKLILDTGTEKNILFSFPKNDSIELFNPIKTKILGVGTNAPIEALLSSKNKLKIKEFEDNNFSVLLLDENNISFISKLGKEVNGIIGYSFFKNKLVEINYDRKKIFLHKNKNYITKRKFRKYTKQNIEVIENRPYLKINTDLNDQKTSLKLLIDTGLSDGLWVFNSDFVQLPDTFLEDYLGYGLSGEIHGKRARIEKIQFSDFEFNEVLVAYPDSLSFNNIYISHARNGSVGGEILKRFHFFIDYENELVFLKKGKMFNDFFHYNMSGIEVQHSGIDVVKEEIRINIPRNEINAMEFVKDNPAYRYNYKFVLKPIFIIGNIRENSPAALVNLKEGDKIISINNKKAHNFTIQKINDLFQSEEGKKIKMEVEREEKIIEVVFYLQKMI